MNIEWLMVAHQFAALVHLATVAQAKQHLLSLVLQVNSHQRVKLYALILPQVLTLEIHT